jgi:endonuclease/exonuclease/phosphatase (EEP) superfamily protein YafD
MQITVLACLALAGALTLALRGADSVVNLCLAATLGAVTAYQLHRMRPYMRLSRHQVKTTKRRAGRPDFSLLIANVLISNRNAEGLLRLIRRWDADVVLVVETDDWWQEQLRSLERSHPFHLQRPQSNAYGMLLFSRRELLDPEIRFLVQPDVPSMHVNVALPSGQRMALHCVHPRPPAPGENTRSTERDAELILIAREVREKDTPVVVAGDLNDVAWSRTTRLFQRISGLRDPRVGRGFYSTYNARFPFFRWPLDHVFLSSHFRLASLKRLPRFGSDHFPIYIAVNDEPETVNKPDKPPLKHEEVAMASDKLQRAGRAG